jgi:hypothetical protein
MSRARKMSMMKMSSKGASVHKGKPMPKEMMKESAEKISPVKKGVDLAKKLKNFHKG